jgi:hypothetical protein
LGGLISFAGSPHGGDHLLLPEWQSQPLIDAETILDHSIVGGSIGAYLFFRDSTGIESHFNLRGRRSGSLDGFILQHMSIDRRADANWHASAHAISIETEDDGDPDTQPWTAKQLASLKWLHHKLAEVKHIPRRRAPESGGGLGYHSMHGAPSEWTNVAGKTCPGKPARVTQFEQILLPAFLAGSLTTEETFMPLTDSDKPIIRGALRDVLSLSGDMEIIQTGQADNDKAWQVLANHFADLRARLVALQGSVGALGDDEANILAAISGVSSGNADVQAIVAAIRQSLPGDVVAAIKEAL